LLRRGLEQLASRHRLISKVRGEGLLIGFDLVDEDGKFLSKEKCAELFKRCLAEGLIMMCYTPRVRVHPPLILSEEQATAALTTIERVVERFE
jgi:4-aminobutyrate aminotransferase-like enzyme